jgi:hypothetical protein
MVNTMKYKFVLSSWNWCNINQAFMLPINTYAAIDLSPLSNPGSLGLFLADKNFKEKSLSKDYRDKLCPKNRKILANSVGLKSIPSGTIGECMFYILTVGADPDGSSMAKPLQPKHNGVNEILCGFSFPIFSSKLMGKKLAHSSWWKNLQATLQNDYRNIRLESIRTASSEYESTLHRRWLECKSRALGFSPSTATKLLIPSDCPKESTVLPATTLSDDFERGDQNDWGESIEGWSWFRISGADTEWVIQSGKGTYSGSTRYPAVIRANQLLSSSDMYAETSLMTSTTNQQDKWFFIRYGGYYTGYVGGFYDAGNQWRLYSSVNNSRTQIGSSLNDFRSAVPMGLEADGSSIRLYETGVGNKVSATNTAVTSGSYSAIASWAGGTGTFDDFETSDLAIPPTSNRKILLFST